MPRAKACRVRLSTGAKRRIMGEMSNPREKLRHVRPVEPIVFPASEPWEEHLGQSKRHLGLCTILAELLRELIGPNDSYGADQYVYWNARTPRVCLAPDGFVKLGVPDEIFDTWKTWEKGVPELAVEVLSPSDTPERWTFAEKLRKYHELGVRELVCFNTDAPPGERLRVWDRLREDLVERVVEDERTPCLTLGDDVEWIVAPAEVWPAALRLVKDGRIVPLARESLKETQARVRAEQERAQIEQERARVEQERARVEQARADAAVKRIAELEAALRAKS